MSIDTDIDFAEINKLISNLNSRKVYEFEKDEGDFVYAAGGFWVVYEAQNGDRQIALRIMHKKDVNGIIERINTIADKLNKNNVVNRHFIKFNKPFELEVQGVTLKTKAMEIDWCTGSTLSFYLRNLPPKEISDKANILSQKFLQLCQDLNSNGVAHGDLSFENIMVEVNGAEINLKLIDIDTLYFKGMGTKLQQCTQGTEGFVHPDRKDKNHRASIYDDRYSQIVIYLILRILSKKPDRISEIDEKGYNNKIFDDLDDDELNNINTAIIEAKEQKLSDIKPINSLVNSLPKSPSQGKTKANVQYSGPIFANFCGICGHKFNNADRYCSQCGNRRLQLEHPLSKILNSVTKK